MKIKRYKITIILNQRDEYGEHIKYDYIKEIDTELCMVPVHREFENITFIKYPHKNEKDLTLFHVDQVAEISIVEVE